MKSIAFKNVVILDEMPDPHGAPQVDLMQHRPYRFGPTVSGDADRLTRTIPAIEGLSDYQHQVMKAIEHYLGDFASMPCIACGRMVKARFEVPGVVTYETCCH